MNPNRFLAKFKKYHFEIKHLLVLFGVLLAFLILVSFVHKISLQQLLINTQNWYQRDSSERMANLTATSLELLLETTGQGDRHSEIDIQRMVQAFNIILSQQQLQQNVQEVCILVPDSDNIIAIDDGQALYDYFFTKNAIDTAKNATYRQAIRLYNPQLRQEIQQSEQIYSIPEGERVFHVFVPFVPKGEFVGAVYVKNTPDFTFITREIIASYDLTALLFAALIILGLLAMFYISSYTVNERDEAQQLLYQERERFLLEKIEREKEELFTRRIYHTHHKAEKVMGFIKEDLRALSPDNFAEVRQRVTRYANFISRVIYDMKWYDPPIQTIRSPVFRTDLNEVIRFIVDNIFLRTSQSATFQFYLELDPEMPAVPINEFVVWEILEPLLQNCIEHGGRQDLKITVRTMAARDGNPARIEISDNGCGIFPELLQSNEAGVKKIFLENVSTKAVQQNSGYGCYLAHEIATRRCGWMLDADNLPEGGCRFVLTIGAAENGRMASDETQPRPDTREKTE